MQTQITHGLLVSFQITGATARGSALTLMEPLGGRVLLGVQSFDGAPLGYNNGLLSLPVTALTPAVQTRAQAQTSFCKAALLYINYESTGALPVNAQGFPTTAEQRGWIQAYEQTGGAATS